MTRHGGHARLEEEAEAGQRVGMDRREALEEELADALDGSEHDRRFGREVAEHGAVG